MFLVFFCVCILRVTSRGRLKFCKSVLKMYSSRPLKEIVHLVPVPNYALTDVGQAVADPEGFPRFPL